MKQGFLVWGALALMIPAAARAQSSPGPRKLSIADAEAIALKNNPTISEARLNALASQQVTREVRSSYYPQSFVNLTGVDALDGSRISAGGLNNPVIYPRLADGVDVHQLVTDFGRTSNLVSSARLSAQAQDQNARATTAEITLAVDQTFFQALQSTAVLKVAQQTVATRQLLVDQVDALTKAKLKSDLDLSFAKVNLAQAQLLLMDAQNRQKAALAVLSAVLGYQTQQEFDLVEGTEALSSPPADVDPLVSEAMAHRPEVAAAQFELEAAQKFHNAEHDLFYPNIQAVGTVGQAPVRVNQLPSHYGAAGFNIQIPVFNGFLFHARAQEADLRAQAAAQHLLDWKTRIARDVRTAWLDATTAFARMDVTHQLLDQANLALELAQTRYNLGLGSIVELSQAQVQQTQAQIDDASARYEYQIAESDLRFQIGM